jgi:enoyl-CoA hydratase/carnithine racemase
MGLANLCVADEALETATNDLVSDILANARRANRAIKQLVRATEGMTLSAGLAYESDHNAGRGPEMADRLERLRRR